MNQYLIPANSKKSLLIFNMFRPFDLFLLLTGGTFTLLFLFIIPGDGFLSLFAKLFPVGICLLLVLPIPYYHNVLVYIQELINYYKRPTQYYWRGWCCTYVGIDDDNKTQSKR